MGKFNLGIGSQMLNEASKAMQTSQNFNVIPIELNLIDPSEDNEGMSLDDIDELAQSILDNGLDQNLVVVRATNGRFTLLSGHRRRLALLKLVEQGHTQYSNVPCLVKDLDSVNLNISQQGKEKFALLTTNIQRRNNTVSDNLKLMQLADEVFEEMKASGQSIGKRREWIAETLGISGSTVRDLTSIDRKTTDKVKQAIDSGKVPLTVATELAQMSEDSQDQFIDEVAKDKDILTASDIETFKKTSVKENKNTSNNSQKKSYSDELSEDADIFINSLKAQKKQSSNALLRKADYNKIKTAQEIIYKQLKKIDAILNANQSEN